MNCPYCDREMRPGTVHFDSRRLLKWTYDGQDHSFWDSLGGVGRLTAADHNWFGSGTIRGDYCSHCKKLIIETDIEK